MLPRYRVAVIGAGILGISIAYFLCGQTRKPGSIVLIEQESNVAQHASGRNTGKVHAPFLYDPSSKKTLAKAAALGFQMWLEFAKIKNLVFAQDGVLEVATDELGVERLYKYMTWGEQNGLSAQELQLLSGPEVKKLEPNVECRAAIYCSKDGSVDYGAFAQALLQDCVSFGCNVMLGTHVDRVTRQENSQENKESNYHISCKPGNTIGADFVVNAAGGSAIDIAHSMRYALEYTDLHFRGEYWEAPAKYKDLTKLSVYSVPRHPEYPFLDPHWIVRADGRREVGPNAVPVFGPYAYSWSKNLADMVPKMIESYRSGARKVVIDKEFLTLASMELKSSLSKTAMINRVKEFLPTVKPPDFTKRGTSGIRSSVVDNHGRFVPDTIVIEREGSINILNYNSPGATGALPMAAKIANRLFEGGIVEKNDKTNSLWDAESISDLMK